MRGSKFSLTLAGLLILLFIGPSAIPATAEEPVLMRIGITDSHPVEQLGGLNLDIATVRPGKYADARWRVVPGLRL